MRSQLCFYAFCLVSFTNAASSIGRSHGDLEISFQGHFSSVEEMNSAREKLDFEPREDLVGGRGIIEAMCLATPSDVDDSQWDFHSCSELYHVSFCMLRHIST